MDTNIWMVILTGVYVIATIAICVANWKTVQEMRKDRRANSNIMLYHDRETVLEKYAQHDYESIAGKVPLLFGMDYYLRMDSIAFREKQELDESGKQQLDVDFRKLFSDMAEFTKKSISR